MERKVALITGITGQDGSFLAEFLLEKGYDAGGKQGTPHGNLQPGCTKPRTGKF